MSAPALTADRVRVLVADDEPVARAGLRAMLAPMEWLVCVGEATNGIMAVELIDALKPDVVFLDIQMPGLSGMEVVSRLQHNPSIIFTTAWSQHAAVAFELGAVDYLLKPFGIERLTLALDRVRSNVGEPGTPSTFDRFREAVRGGPISRVFVRSGRTIVPIAVESISWFEADGDYVAIHVGRTRHLVHVALSRLESRLDPARFARIHRTRIVNLDRVVAFRTVAPGRLVAELDDGTRLEVSRSKARELRALGE